MTDTKKERRSFEVDQEEKKDTHQVVPEKDINDELTIESMFKVYDKDAGIYVDLREIMDLQEEDFKDNFQMQQILKQVNESNPIQQLPPMPDPASVDMSLGPTKYYISNTKLSSIPINSQLEGMVNEENLKSLAIIQNRMTQFNTLQLPSYVEEAIKKERKYLQHLSVEQQQKRITQLLQESNQQSWQDWWTIKMQRNQELIQAVRTNQVQKVKDLLNETKNQDLCADVNFQHNQDLTPLHYAVQCQNIDTLNILIERNAELNARTQTGETALHQACKIANFDIVKTLTKLQETFVDIEDYRGNTPLHFAAMANSIKIVTHLTKNCKANPSIFNNSKQKPRDFTQDPNIRGLLDEYEVKYQEEKKKVGKNMVSQFFSKFMKGGRENQQSDEQGQTLFQEGEDEDGKFGTRQTNVFEKKTITIQDINDSPARANSEISTSVNLKDFNIIERLGKGSFGSVYLVEKKSNTQIYAMKVLEKEKILKQNLVRYAMTERNVLCLAKHPFIVSLNYAFQTTQRLYLILEYCPGGDMGMALSKQKRFPEETARMYLCEIILAIEYLHQNNIVFRDLKPDNVVFDEDGHALLTDFGLSKEGLGGAQQSQSFCGSVAYLAPEMLKRQGHTKSIDWYLLGVLLYEMIVGVPPYFSTDRQKLFENIQGGPLKIPHTMSENARGLILQLLNRNPMKRLGAGPRDSEDIKSHIFFKDVDWKMVIDRKLPVPKPRIRKIEQNPAISIQSFLLEEEKHDGGANPEQAASPRQGSQPQQLSPRKQTMEQQASPRNGKAKGGEAGAAGEDQSKIPGWSYIKKPNPHQFRKPQ